MYGMVCMQLSAPRVLPDALHAPPSPGNSASCAAFDLIRGQNYTTGRRGHGTVRLGGRCRWGEGGAGKREGLAGSKHDVCVCVCVWDGMRWTPGWARPVWWLVWAASVLQGFFWGKESEG